MKACAMWLLLHWLFNKALVQTALVPLQIWILQAGNRARIKPSFGGSDKREYPTVINLTTERNLTVINPNLTLNRN